jgi:CheY-like chemotaxis protein
MKRILVVDDKDAARELVRTILETRAYQVVEAGDGLEALKRARDERPDLIIVDIQMPGLDGFGVIQELRRDRRFAETPVIALTASAMKGDRERAMGMGFTCYITKPIRPTALLSEVERLLAEA